MPLNSSDIEKVNRFIIADIKAQLRLQGHYLTGALESSLTSDVSNKKNESTLSSKAYQYIESLEQGIPASAIVINSQTLAEMTRYVELRMGYRGGKAQRVALLILQKQAKEGNPTNASKAYSKTGQRTQAIKTTFKQNEGKYFSLIDTQVENFIDEEFNKIKSETI